jgi:CBS-domain-containing membrane protein
LRGRSPAAQSLREKPGLPLAAQLQQNAGMAKPIVKSVMTRDIFAVEPETTLAMVARLFELHGISGVPVIDDAGRALGLITKTDLLNSARKRTEPRGPSRFHRVRDGAVISSGTLDDAHRDIQGVVADVMSWYTLSVLPTTPVEEAARLIIAEGVHRLLILEHGRVVGILTPTDCLRALLPVQQARQQPAGVL